MKNVYVLGSKGIPAKYGGFETFVDQLVSMKEDASIKYHVSCLGHLYDNPNDEKYFTTEYKGATCHHFKVPKIGPAIAVLYDIIALKKFLQIIKENNDREAVIYILACRIGPFMGWFKRKAQKLGVKVLVNPDGHEWKRQKWNKPIRAYWKLSEKLMVKHADLLVCDNLGIEEYIREDYVKYKPQTDFIAYGASARPSAVENEEDYIKWLNKHGLKEKEYYLIVGRFVPENNYEVMIREFMASSSKKDLAIITNVEKNKFYEQLQATTNFESDSRIKFVGTVYDKEMLMRIREDAYGYIHGHSVGGTNPSLLEALASTELNLLFDVSFNKRVGKDSCLYFSSKKDSMKSLIDECDQIDEVQLKTYGRMSTKIIDQEYQWERIVDKYEELFNKMV